MTTHCPEESPVLSYSGDRSPDGIVDSGVKTLEDVAGGLEMVEVEIASDAPVADKRLDEIRLPRGSLIVSDVGGSRIGGPDTVLESGNRYVVAVQSDVADEVMNLLGG